MFRRKCHLILDLTPAQCGQLLSRVNDAKGLEELSLEVCLFQLCAAVISNWLQCYFNMIICSFLKILDGSDDEGPHSVCDDVTVKAVEEVYSNCRLRKMRLQFESHFSHVSSHSLSPVVS